MEISEILDKYRDMEIVRPAPMERLKTADQLKFNEDILVGIPDKGCATAGYIGILMHDSKNSEWRLVTPFNGMIKMSFMTYSEGVDWFMDNFPLEQVYSFGCYENALRFILDVVEEVRKI